MKIFVLSLPLPPGVYQTEFVGYIFYAVFIGALSFMPTSDNTMTQVFDSLILIDPLYKYTLYSTFLQTCSNVSPIPHCYACIRPAPHSWCCLLHQVVHHGISNEVTCKIKSCLMVTRQFNISLKSFTIRINCFIQFQYKNMQIT